MLKLIFLFSRCDRIVSDNNEQHDTEICSARSAAEDDVARQSDIIVQNLDGKYCQDL